MNIGKVAMIGAGVALMLAIGWRVQGVQGEAAKLAGDQNKRKGAPLQAEIITVGPKTVSTSVTLVGNIEAPLTVRLSPKITGRIDSVSVREGDVVKAGQALVQIDRTEVEGEVLERRAALAEAKSKLAQAEIGVGATDAGVQAQIKQQQAAYISATADVNQQRQTLNSQIATAEAAVTDSTARVAAAVSAIATARADLATAKATRDNAKSKADRAQNLFDQGYISAQEKENAVTALSISESAILGSQTRVDAAESALKSAQAALQSSRSQSRIIGAKAKSDLTAAEARKTQADAARDVANANTTQSKAYRENIDALKATVSVAAAQLVQAESRRADTTLVSPIAGVVTKRNADPGTIASSSAEILVISALDPVFVVIQIPIEESSVATVGRSLPVTVESLPGKTWTATISEVNPSADPATRQFTVRAKLSNPGNVLRPGMFTRATLTSASVNAAAYVSREAVRQVKGEATVFVVQPDDTVKATPVTTGAEDATGFQITSGLTAGERVVNLSYAVPKDGQKIGKPKGKGDDKKGSERKGDEEKTKA